MVVDSTERPPNPVVELVMLRAVTEALVELAGRVPLAVWSNKPHPFTVAMV